MRILGAFVALLATVGVASAEIQFGLAKAKFVDRPWSTSEHRALMEEYGANDYAAVFWNLFSPDNLAHPFDWVRDNYLENGCVPVIVTILPNGVNEDSIARSELSEGETRALGNHDDILAGVYDEAIEAFAIRLRDAMARSGCNQDVIINLMHEADGSWYAWGMDAIGNSAQSYASAYIHIVEIFRRVDAPVQFQLNLNRRDGRFQVMRLIDEWFPLLDPYVDRYAVSSYNRCGTTDDATEYRSFWQEFGPAYRMLAERTDKPIDVAEVSTSTLCRGMEDKLLWFEEMLASLTTYAPQTERVTFFFGDIDVGEASNEVVIEWGVPPEYRDDFRVILEHFRALQETRVVPAEPVPAQTESRQTRVVSVTPTAPPLRLPEPVREVESVTVAGDTTCYTMFCFDSAPWSLWANVSVPLYEEGNPVLNTVTGQPFGDAGPVLRFTARQRFLWNEGDILHGPGFVVSGTLSENDNQWWNNQASAGITYGLYGDVPRGAVLWGGWSAEIFAGYREYFASTPNRLSGGEEIIELRFGVNFGGDWSR